MNYVRKLMSLLILAGCLCPRLKAQTPAPLYPVGPELTDQQFLDGLDLNWTPADAATLPHWNAVVTQIQAGNYAAAKTAYAQFLKNRTDVWYMHDSSLPSDYPNTQPLTSTRQGAARVADNYEINGRNFGSLAAINWQDCSDIGSCEKLHRHDWMSPLYKTFIWGPPFTSNPWWNNVFYISEGGYDLNLFGNVRLAVAFEEIMNDYIDANPTPNTLIPNTQFVGLKCGWQTLSTGLRVHEEINAYVVFKKVLSDGFLFKWAKYLHQVNLYLRDFGNSDPQADNWIQKISAAMVQYAILFPEVSDNASVLQQGISWIDQNSPIYPDFAQSELAPGYQSFVLDHYREVAAVSRNNGYDSQFNTDVFDLCDRYMRYFIRTMRPNHQFPPLNASENTANGAKDVPRMAKDFKTLADLANTSVHPNIQYWGTDGASGSLPSYTSINLDYAGQAVMREDWSEDAHYALMEYGTAGTAHQHEDKLGIMLTLEGDLFVGEYGKPNYCGMCEEEHYGRTTRAHSALTIDNLTQNRFSKSFASDFVTAPLSSDWQSNATYDYISGSYGDQPGELYAEALTPQRGLTNSLDRGVWKRHLLYLKPGFFVVLDAVNPADNNPHSYQSHFHLRTDNQATLAQLSTTNQRVNLTETGRPNFTLQAVAKPGQTLNQFKGLGFRNDLGWMFQNQGWAYGHKQVPTVVFEQTNVTGDATFAYVFQANPNGQAAPTPSITEIASNQDHYGVSLSWESEGVMQSANVYIDLDRDGQITLGGTTYASNAILEQNGTLIDLPSNTPAGTGGACPPAGTACDDNDPNTHTDLEDGNCNCQGTPANPGSGTNACASLTRYEAESANFEVDPDGDNRALPDPVLSNGLMWQVRDQGDQIGITFPVDAPGDYILRVHLRSGYQGGNGDGPYVDLHRYQFSLDGQNLALSPDSSSLQFIPFGDHWFTTQVSAPTTIATTGSHTFLVENDFLNWQYALVDYFEVEALGISVSADAGPDQQLAHDLGSLNLTGVATGCNASLQWTQLSGPGLTLVDAQQETVQVEGLQAGQTYTLELTVTDGQGQTASDQVVLTTACPPAGLACDDGNAASLNDTTDGNCGCAGTFLPTCGPVPFTTTSFTPQTNAFAATFEVVVRGNDLDDGIVGFGHLAAASAFNDMAAIMQFNQDGSIKARNGGSYQAVQALNWSGNQVYQVELQVDMTSQTYDLTVTPLGGVAHTIADDYAFRSNWTGTNSLSSYTYWTWNGGCIEVQNFSLSTAKATRPTAIAEAAAAPLQAKLVPNPNFGAFEIHLNQVLEPEADIRIFNLQGQEVDRIPAPDSRILALNLPELAPGTYLIHIQQGREILHLRLLRQ